MSAPELYRTRAKAVVARRIQTFERTRVGCNDELEVHVPFRGFYKLTYPHGSDAAAAKVQHTFHDALAVHSHVVMEFAVHIKSD
jgi:hypothetical protein